MPDSWVQEIENDVVESFEFLSGLMFSRSNVSDTW
jgi:hypothetical protein